MKKNPGFLSDSYIRRLIGLRILLIAIALCLALGAASAQITITTEQAEAAAAAADQATGRLTIETGEYSTAEFDFDYMQNPDLAYNQIEINLKNLPEAYLAAFFHQVPAERPAGVPANYILVQAFGRKANGFGFVWLGWLYMDANFVNWLHQGPTL